MINLEKKICEPFKELYQIGIIEKKTYGKLCPVRSYFGVLFGRKFSRPELSLSAIGTPTYNIAKFFVSILKPLTTNDYTFKDTFEFSLDILNQNPNLFMASLDVDSLLTNKTLDETISIIIERLFAENENVHNLNKDQFKCLLTLTTKESHFLLMGNYTNKFMVLLRFFSWALTLANIFFATMRISGYVIVYQNANLTMTNVMWTIFLFFLSQKLKLSRSKNSWTLIILIWNSHPKKKITSNSIF